MSAIGWLGGGILTTFVLGPNVKKLAPAAALEFNAKVLPRIVRFVQMMIGTTFLFGLLLLYAVSDGDFTWLSTSPQGLELSEGIGLALVTSVVVFAVTVPSFKQVSKLAAAALAAGQPPAPEMMKYAMRARKGSLAGVGLLLIVLSLMVAAGFT